MERKLRAINEEEDALADGQEMDRDSDVENQSDHDTNASSEESEETVPTLLYRHSAKQEDNEDADEQ